MFPRRVENRFHLLNRITGSLGAADLSSRHTIDWVLLTKFLIHSVFPNTGKEAGVVIYGAVIPPCADRCLLKPFDPECRGKSGNRFRLQR